MKDKRERELHVIAQSGYDYKDVPAIILKGKWLSDYGFTAGKEITVTCQQVLYRQFQKSFATLTKPLESFSEDVWFTFLDHVTVNSPTDVKYTFRDDSII